jgi:3-hydroxyisobutyrate dehydrogenase-like beta-hydroxyacid dehydrogenase
MGASLGRALMSREVRVVTTLAGRGHATRRRCADTGIEALPSLGDVARVADVVLSVVPPAAAEEVAEEYGRCAGLAPQGAIYVDANSIAPDLAISIGRRIADLGLDFVDASVNGLAANLSTTGTLYLSGTCAARIVALFDNATRVRVLGEDPGQASAMKMLLAGLSKGVCALYLELALAACGMGLADALTTEAARIYPGISALIHRMLPTYAQHAARRATETAEVERTAQAAGLDPIVLTAVRQAHERLAAAIVERPADPSVTSVEQFVQHLAEGESLARAVAVDQYPAESSFIGGSRGK